MRLLEDDSATDAILSAVHPSLGASLAAKIGPCHRSGLEMVTSLPDDQPGWTGASDSEMRVSLDAIDDDTLLESARASKSVDDVLGEVQPEEIRRLLDISPEGEEEDWSLFPIIRACSPQLPDCPIPGHVNHVCPSLVMCCRYSPPTSISPSVCPVSK